MVVIFVNWEIIFFESIKKEPLMLGFEKVLMTNPRFLIRSSRLSKLVACTFPNS